MTARRVTLTIPAENIDDFRIGAIADLEGEAEGFGTQHNDLLEAIDNERDDRWISGARSDRDTRVRQIRETYELIGQLPDGDVEATVSGTAVAFRFALEHAGQALIDRVERLFKYGPVPVEQVLPVVDRLRWTCEQAAMIGEGE